MKYLIVLGILLCSVYSQAIQMWNIVVGHRNFGRQFTMNGIINPQVIAVLHSVEASFDLGMTMKITLENTNVKFKVNIKIKSFTYSSIVYQVMLISGRPQFEVQNDLLLTYQNPEMNFTSFKKLKSMPAGEGGDIAVRTFITGWSGLTAMAYTSLITTYYNEEGIFTITGTLQDVPTTSGNNSWITVSVIIMGQSLIPQCKDSIYQLLVDLIAEHRQIIMQQNMTYFLGVIELFDFFVSMRFGEENRTITLSVGWSLIKVGYLKINDTCYNQVTGDVIIPTFFQKWKIIVIGVVGAGGVLLLVGLVFFCKWFWADDEQQSPQKEGEESNVNLNNQKDTNDLKSEGNKKIQKSFAELGQQTPDIIIVRK